ncbi:MAG: glycoside hydrolase family 15 protein, partial [Verrucomicrobiota bacterium]|nr:glycoside hydrolase family 15 protein [Verrucomicrobiota bacterium]
VPMSPTAISTSVALHQNNSMRWTVTRRPSNRRAATGISDPGYNLDKPARVRDPARPQIPDSWPTRNLLPNALVKTLAAPFVIEA